MGFFSRQLRGAQQRYSAQELEGLAVFEGVRHFAYYLYGREFTVLTDHKGLVNLMESKQENRRLYGWALKLTEFNFKIVYRSGKENIVADGLSCCYVDESAGSDQSDESECVLDGAGCASVMKSLVSQEKIASDDVTHLFQEGGDVGPKDKPRPT